ncbi:MAG: methyltransferase domain-containing protein [Blastocatellia bacterium]
MSDQAENEQALDSFARMMKSDWNRRARENARWFINTVRLDQSEEEFDATGANEVRNLILPELALMTQGRDPKTLRFLEMGCGIGRMTKHLAAIFGEVHATDVSGEMIGQARQRLRDLPNTHLHETSGVDFAGLPDNYFDIAFSAFVFQHVPSKDVIRSNIGEAYRVVKPGGVLKLHTNGVESRDYESADKDTWAGATFTEGELRELARELGARLLSVYGAKTMYCWTTMRKPTRSKQGADLNPKIEFHARSDDATIRTIPTGGAGAWLSLVVSGLDREAVDANNLKIVINDQAATPRCVGRVRPHFESELKKRFGPSLDHLIYVETAVPAGLSSGAALAWVELDGGPASPPYEVGLEEPKPLVPIIVTIRNGEDYGTDIYVRGPKSSLRLFVEGLDGTATRDNVRVKTGGRIVTPAFVDFVADIAGYRVDAELPANIEPGQINLTLTFNGVESEPAPVEVRAIED